MTGKEIRIKETDEAAIDTILAPDIDFEGELTFQKPLMIKGRFRGKVDAGSDLFVGEQAVMEATIRAATVSSKGSITGDITASRRVELFSTARMRGDVQTPELVVESGCVFNGSCHMREEGQDGASR